MKKIFTLFAATLFAMGLMAQSYGIAVNGKTYYAGTQNPEPLDPSFQEFMVLGLSVNAGDKLQLWDPTGNDGKGAGWAVPLDNASTTKITLDGDHYVCNEADCFNFYIKLKYEHDQLYVGEGECGSPTGTDITGGGDDPGTNPGDNPDAYWYWKGFVDGQDINNEIDGGIFDCGISEITVEENGYIFVVYQVKGVPGVQYMAPTYVDGPTHATLTTTGSDKLHIPAGSYTLYLYNNGDGTVELAFEAMSGKKLVDCTDQAIDNTEVVDNARKVIVDGQLRIIHGDKVFDATGRQLQDK